MGKGRGEAAWERLVGVRGRGKSVGAVVGEGLFKTVLWRERGVERGRKGGAVW